MLSSGTTAIKMLLREPKQSARNGVSKFKAVFLNSPHVYDVTNIGESNPAAAYQVDMTPQKAVQEAVDMAVSEPNNRLDIFVANARIPWTKGPILDAGEEGFGHYRKIIATNIDGV